MYITTSIVYSSLVEYEIGVYDANSDGQSNL